MLGIVKDAQAVEQHAQAWIEFTQT